MNNTSRRNFIKTTGAIGSFFILPSVFGPSHPMVKFVPLTLEPEGRDGLIRSTWPSMITLKWSASAMSITPTERSIPGPNNSKAPPPFRITGRCLPNLAIKSMRFPSPPPTTLTTPPPWMRWNGANTFTCKNSLTHKLDEARHLAKFAKEKGLTTQMGIQNQSREAYRLARHYVQEGIIGKISKVYVWSFKTWGYDGEPFKEKSVIPDTLEWNLWLGTAPNTTMSARSTTPVSGVSSSTLVAEPRRHGHPYFRHSL